MSYFTYDFASHFFYPPTVTTNYAYNGVSGTLVAPFTGTNINNNFYYLACSAVDNTTRIGLLEDQDITVTAGNPDTGYVLYNGTTDVPGNFYGGEPLLLEGNGTNNSFTCTSSPNYVTLGSTTTYSFRALTGGSTVYTSGVYNSALSNVRTIVLGETVATNYTSISSLVSYLNGKLTYNNKDAYSPAMACQLISGSITTANFGPTTFLDTTTVKYFYLYVNDSYFQPATTSYYRCTISPASYTYATLASALQTTLNLGAVDLGYSSSTFSVSVYNTNQLKITLNASRTDGGIYEFCLVEDVDDDGAYTSILKTPYFTYLPSISAAFPDALPFGLLNGVTSVAEAFDLSSLFQFSYTGTGPYSLTVEGQQSSAVFTFFDEDGSSATGLFNSTNISPYSNGIGMGLSLATDVSSLGTIYYHSRYPSSLTYSTVPILNFGGDLNVNNLSCFDMEVMGSITYSGTVTFSGSQTFGILTASNLGVNGTSQITGYFDGGVEVPTVTSGRANFSGILYASLHVGDIVGVNIPSYIYNVPYSTNAPIGYVVYGDDPAGATPVNGIGDEATTISLSTTSNSALYKTYDNLLTKTAVDSQGQGTSYDFAIDYGMISQTFQISFLYNTSSSYVSGDIGVFLYDTAYSVFVPLSVSSISASNGFPSRFLATFSPSFSTSYRLIFHITTTNASAYTFQFNAVSVSPLSLMGVTTTAVNQWANYSMVIGAVTSAPALGTVANNLAQWRRVGADMELEYNLVQTGAGSAGTGTYLFPLPVGYTVDWTKISASATYNNNVPVGTGRVVDGANVYTASVYYNASLATNAVILVYQSTIGTDVLVSSTNTPLSTATLEYHFICKLPIAQWDAAINLASDFTEYAGNTGAEGTSANTTYTSATYKTIGALGNPFCNVNSASTSNQYTGYQVTFQNPIQKNDIILVEVYDAIHGWASISERGIGRSIQNTTQYGIYWDYVVSDLYSVNVFFGNGGAYSNGATYGAVSATTWTAIAATSWYWRVRKISHGNFAEQPPVVRVEYQSNSVTGIPTTGNPICYDLVVEDTHISVTNPSSNWQFTAPMPGVYSIEVTAGFTSGRTYSAGELWSIHLYKDGAYYTTLSSYTFGAGLTTSNSFVLCGNKTIRLNTGDYISTNIYYSGTNTGTAWDVGTVNAPRIAIERIGN